MKTSLVFGLAVVILGLAVEANGLRICPYGVSEDNGVTMCQDPLLTGACGVFQGEVKSFTPVCLWRMNRYRRLHNAHALQWDRALATSAERWAKNLASDNEIADTGSGDDENQLFQFPAVPCDAAVNTWYSVVACYHPDSPGPNFANIAHFAQMVWKGSRRVGCGVAGRYMCCNYNPHGNTLTADAFLQNVEIPRGWTLPAGLKPPSKCSKTSNRVGHFSQANVIGQRLGTGYDDMFNNVV
ncbi:protein PRY1-like [Branchiostoma floridae]|uniref:Protein PRY1-like n=1 Tax=Branchiostoma floridae TaxID=7739 RepID=A0A9J7HMX5_BRAFL|nr:protein PRY1-like [Branchiostoma floridae]